MQSKLYHVHVSGSSSSIGSVCWAAALCWNLELVFLAMGPTPHVKGANHFNWVCFYIRSEFQLPLPVLSTAPSPSHQPSRICTGLKSTSGSVAFFIAFTVHIGAAVSITSALKHAGLFLLQRTCSVLTNCCAASPQHHIYIIDEKLGPA